VDTADPCNNAVVGRRGDGIAARYAALEEQGIPIRAGTGESLLGRWDVPLKDGPTESGWILNWRAIAAASFTVGGVIGLTQWCEAFVRMFGCFDSLPPDARAKHENAVAFMNASRSLTRGLVAERRRSVMNRWFHYRFRMVWPEDDQEPHFWCDIMLLDTVVRDVINTHRKPDTLWRIHRMAAREDQSGQPSQAGHQFTLLLFTDEQTAEEIDREVGSHPAVAGMRQHQLLREYCLEKEQGEDIGQVSGTSDKVWSVEVQRSWPYYIMGVSEMLLDLVAHCRAGAEIPGFDGGPDAPTTLYRQLHGRLSAIWQNEGQHAFLHHLNALFGYVPLIVAPNCVKAQFCSF
jgi:hypothetical protein